jgi:hypothetical protein
MEMRAPQQSRSQCSTTRACWLRRRRARIAAIEAEADALIHNSGAAAYSTRSGESYSEQTMFSFGQWKYSADRDATINAYRREERGGVDTCDCANCRNFRIARNYVFPASFLGLLDQLGIDPFKDAEVYHNARLSAGRHDYCGWYHFVGSLDETEELPVVQLGDGFTAWMCHTSGPTLASLGNALTVQLEFHAEQVPWLLNEPEPAWTL